MFKFIIKRAGCLVGKTGVVMIAVILAMSFLIAVTTGLFYSLSSEADNDISAVYTEQAYQTSLKMCEGVWAALKKELEGKTYDDLITNMRMKISDGTATTVQKLIVAIWDTGEGQPLSTGWVNVADLNNDGNLNNDGVAFITELSKKYIGEFKIDISYVPERSTADFREYRIDSYAKVFNNNTASDSENRFSYGFRLYNNEPPTEISNTEPPFRGPIMTFGQGSDKSKQNSNIGELLTQYLYIDQPLFITTQKGELLGNQNNINSDIYAYANLTLDDNQSIGNYKPTDIFVAGNLTLGNGFQGGYNSGDTFLKQGGNVYVLGNLQMENNSVQWGSVGKTVNLYVYGNISTTFNSSTFQKVNGTFNLFMSSASSFTGNRTNNPFSIHSTTAGGGVTPQVFPSDVKANVERILERATPQEWHPEYNLTLDGTNVITYNITRVYDYVTAAERASGQTPSGQSAIVCYETSFIPAYKNIVNNRNNAAAGSNIASGWSEFIVPLDGTGKVTIIAKPGGDFAAKLGSGYKTVLKYAGDTTDTALTYTMTISNSSKSVYKLKGQLGDYNYSSGFAALTIDTTAGTPNDATDDKDIYFYLKGEPKSLTNISFTPLNENSIFAWKKNYNDDTGMNVKVKGAGSVIFIIPKGTTYYACKNLYIGHEGWGKYFGASDSAVWSKFFLPNAGTEKPDPYANNSNNYYAKINSMFHGSAPCGLGSEQNRRYMVNGWISSFAGATDDPTNRFNDQCVYCTESELNKNGVRDYMNPPMTSLDDVNGYKKINNIRLAANGYLLQGTYAKNAKSGSLAVQNYPKEFAEASNTTGYKFTHLNIFICDLSEATPTTNNHYDTKGATGNSRAFSYYIGSDNNYFDKTGVLFGFIYSPDGDVLSNSKAGDASVFITGAIIANNVALYTKQMCYVAAKPFDYYRKTTAGKGVNGGTLYGEKLTYPPDIPYDNSTKASTNIVKEVGWY